MREPKLTVLMSVYNAAEHLGEAIKSILDQTFSDFEFLIINDGSTDNSLSIINSFDDPRIRVISRENKGLVASLNEGIEESRTDLIARQDADDISLPDRLEKEMAYLEGHPDVVLVGSFISYIKENGEKTGINIVAPFEDRDIKRRFMRGNTFNHGSVLMRKSAVLEVGKYRPDAWPAEDYDLWVRLSSKYRVANIPEVLYIYRLNPEGISFQRAETQEVKRKEISESLWENMPEIKLKEEYTRAKWYKALSNPLRREIFAVYTDDLAHLSLLYLRKFRFLNGFKLFLAIALTNPRYSINYAKLIARNLINWFKKKSGR